MKYIDWFIVQAFRLQPLFNVEKPFQQRLTPVYFLSHLQVKKTWGATLTTLQDMTVLEDCDVSQSFTHSPSSESVKSSVSDSYLNKPSLAKRRANQQETELFYFNVRNADAGLQMGGACTHKPTRF